MCRRKTKLENADLHYVKWFKEIHKATIVNNINARFHEKKLIFGQLLTILQCSSIDYMIPNHQKSLQRSWFPVFTWCYSHFLSVVSREQFRFRFEITLIASLLNIFLNYTFFLRLLFFRLLNTKPKNSSVAFMQSSFFIHSSTWYCLILMKETSQGGIQMSRCWKDSLNLLYLKGEN